MRTGGLVEWSRMKDRMHPGGKTPFRGRPRNLETSQGMSLFITKR